MQAGLSGDASGEGLARAPLLLPLVFFAVGIAVWRLILDTLPLFAVALLALSGAVVVLSLSRKGGWGWHLALAGVCFLLGYGYAGVRLPNPMPERAALPAREAELVLRVERLFATDQWGRRGGVAQVVDAAHLLGRMDGQRVLFRTKEGDTLAEGGEFRMKGLFKRRPPAEDAGGFDAWLEQGGVYFDFTRASVLETVHPPPLWRQNLAELRGHLSLALRSGSEKMPEIRAMLPAMFLGEKRLLDEDDEALFRTTGMMHLFAVSGLHVGLVALLVEGLLGLLRIGRRGRAVCGMVVLLGYVLLIGAPPSAVRAFIMLLFHRAGSLWGRPARGLPSLCASALAVLLWNPAQLFDVGARLSYGIVAGILLYGLPLGEALRKSFRLYEMLPMSSIGPLRRAMLGARDWLCEGAGVCAGAFLVGAPLSVQYFGVFAPGSMLLNLLLVPLAFLSVSAAALASVLFLAGLAPGLGALALAGGFVSKAGWTGCLVMEALISAGGALPLLFFKMRFPLPWMGTALALALLAWAVHLEGCTLRSRLMPFAALFIFCALVGVS